MSIDNNSEKRLDPRLKKEVRLLHRYCSKIEKEATYTYYWNRKSSRADEYEKIWIDEPLGTILKITEFSSYIQLKNNTGSLGYFEDMPVQEMTLNPIDDDFMVGLCLPGHRESLYYKLFGPTQINYVIGKDRICTKVDFRPWFSGKSMDDSKALIVREPGEFEAIGGYLTALYEHLRDLRNR